MILPLRYGRAPAGAVHVSRQARTLSATVQRLLLPVQYFHVVFTLPAPIAAISYSNKELVYGLLFEIAAATLRIIAADPKHL
jgi:hypothetical protein